MKVSSHAPRTVTVALSLALALALALATASSAAQSPPADTASPEVAIGTVVFLGDSGGVDTARITDIFTHHLQQFQVCYAHGLSTSPTLSGELQVDVTYNRHGRTTAVTSTGLADVPSVGQCVAAIVRPFHLPHPSTRETPSLRFLATVQFTRPVPPPSP